MCRNKPYDRLQVTNLQMTKSSFIASLRKNTEEAMVDFFIFYIFFLNIVADLEVDSQVT